MTLMEVLISAFILSVGLLGLAALLPVGRVTVGEAIKADRAGTCGRSAMHEVKVRRMLDPATWSPAPNTNQLIPYTGSFAIDPLGSTGPLGGAIPHISLNAAAMPAGALPIFMCQDDLLFSNPEEMTPPVLTTLRPQPTVAGSPPAIQAQGNYTWFLTVTPSLSESFVTSPAEQTHFMVSVVVCNRRNFTPPAN